MKKKKNKNDLVIKTKQRILRETKSSQKEYITTYKDIKRYFRVFNKTLFKGKLNAFNDIQIKNRRHETFAIIMQMRPMAIIARRKNNLEVANIWHTRRRP